MQYKIINLRIKNFKCFDNSKFYEFNIDYDKNPVILSGPNGFGKTTFFDAVELIFSNNITRLDSNIERKSINLGKNILLNQADEDGYVILSLENEQQEIVTLFAKISKDNHKLDVQKSILYGGIKELITTEQLDSFLKNYDQWNECIDNENFIKYRAENFNVYYYVSQAESVHFLKKTITDRKNAMNVLLNTGNIDERKSRVLNLIGKTKTTSGYLFNDEKNALDQKLKEKATKLKLLLGNVQNQVKKEEYVDLKLYQNDPKLYFWDNPDIEKFNCDDIKTAFLTVEGIISFLENKSDYENHKWNKEIEKVFTDESITDYVQKKEYVLDNVISIEKINKQLENWEQTIMIYNDSLFFRQEILDVDKYNKKDIVDLKELIPGLENYDFNMIESVVEEIINLKRNYSNTNIIIDKLKRARVNLKIAKNKYNSDGLACPFCNTKFSDTKALNDGFEEVDQLLEKESGIVGNRIKLKNEELQKYVEEVKIIIQPYVKNLDDDKIKTLRIQQLRLSQFIKDSRRVSSVEKIIEYLNNIGYVSKNEGEREINDIKSIIPKLYKKITNTEFDSLYLKYKYEDIRKVYYEDINYLIDCNEQGMLTQKYRYLKALFSRKGNSEINEIENQIKGLIIRRHKVEKVRQKLEELRKVYENSIKKYENITLSQLRVPLLIYTGKILQDYQNGLGVFINKDEMRFVSNGEAKHDILNTFSSGQLSGFVLAFLFAMNKQYIKASSDDIGFILIDDPVQTMDDINISSLIEVLRNDFLDKQIILSTHEIDKENYILYKFFKYNMIGQSFNVKEEIYK